MKVANLISWKKWKNGCWTKNRGFPPKWMVYNGSKPYEQIGMIWGFSTPILGSTQMKRFPLFFGCYWNCWFQHGVFFSLRNQEIVHGIVHENDLTGWIDSGVKAAGLLPPKMNRWNMIPYIYIYILLLFMSIHTYIMSKSIYIIHFDITIHTSRTRQGGLSSWHPYSPRVCLL